MSRALSLLWFVPPIVTIASGAWMSVAGADLAAGVTDKARSFQDTNAGPALVTLEEFTTNLGTTADGKSVKLVTGTPDKGSKAAVSSIAAGDTVFRTLDLMVTPAQKVTRVTLTTKAATKNALTTALTVGIKRCNLPWDTTTTPYTCADTTEVLVGDVPLVGNTISVLDPSELRGKQTSHLLLELRVPSDAGNSAAGQEADLTFRFDGTQGP